MRDEPDRAKRTRVERTVIALLVALACFCAAEFARAAEPIVIRADAPAVAYLPSGDAVSLPAGTEIDACAATGGTIAYRAHVARIQNPCGIRPPFRNGFE